MQRNKRLSMEILACVEAEDMGTGVSAADIGLAVHGHRGALTDIDEYHVKLLVDCGLLKVEEDDHFFTHSYHLTWSGHDLLDALRSEFST
ncbi:hypothetical protein LT42_17185 [Pseudomonas lutea]|uniref:Uncharacterized protein n=1 Tax=Pseudomonas lutea TaxID=243924 RepID=A0A9X0ED90_9PSED|nr:hypothetical protein LT42_17185 [Pseudomonas lutea]